MRAEEGDPWDFIEMGYAQNQEKDKHAKVFPPRLTTCLQLYVEIRPYSLKNVTILLLRIFYKLKVETTKCSQKDDYYSRQTCGVTQ